MVDIIKIDIEDNNIDKKLAEHGNKIAPTLANRTNDMLLLVENNVKFVTHRGQHCKGKGGTTKSAIRHKLTGNGGMVYADEGIAPWLKWYIGGRGSIVPKVAKFLRFCIAGTIVFAKKVKPWKGHDIFNEGLQRSEPELNKKIQSLGRWLSEI